jgi:hypothetical protein
MNPIRTAASAATGSTHLHTPPVYVRVSLREYAIPERELGRFVTSAEFFQRAFVKRLDSVEDGG